MNELQYLVETRDLTKTYGSTDPIVALDHVNIRIMRGELLSVMGPSGSGKSTLLNLLGALDKPTEGQAYVTGQNVETIRNLDKFRAQTIGFIFQMHNLIPTLNALENVEMPMIGQVRNRKHRRQRARRLLDRVGLGDRIHHLPNQLSGGQRQRVAIARALANEPDLILADEPTGNLDSQSGAEVISLLHDLNDDMGTTIIIVTHDHAVARQTERVLVMEDGRIIDDHKVGHPYDEDLKTFRNSGLGKAILDGDAQALDWLANRGLKTLLNVLS